jgi:hypothetical protein
VPISTSLRIWFCLATAVVAAALADPAMEFISNAGVFGRTDFTDHSNLDVVPTLGAGLLIVFTYLYLRLRQLFVVDNCKRPRIWLRASTDAFRNGMLARLVPAIFLTQILVLFVMETAEQYIVEGHVLGGTVWLGGPAPLSLALHAAVCVSVTFGAARVLSAFARAAVQLVGLVLLLIAVAARRSGPALARFTYPRSFRPQAPVLGRTGDRAPPFLTA